MSIDTWQMWSACMFQIKGQNRENVGLWAFHTCVIFGKFRKEGILAILELLRAENM